VDHVLAAKRVGPMPEGDTGILKDPVTHQVERHLADCKLDTFTPAHHGVIVQLDRSWTKLPPIKSQCGNFIYVYEGKLRRHKDKVGDWHNCCRLRESIYRCDHRGRGARVSRITYPGAV
jgi:hypothetical protein